MNLEEMQKLEGELESRIVGNPEQGQEKPEDAPVETVQPEAVNTVEDGSLETAPEDTPEATPIEAPEATATKLAELDKRFRNYKASTDKTIFELRQEKANLTGDLAKALEEVSSLRDRLEGHEAENVEYPFTEEDEKVVGPEAMEIFKRTFKESLKNANAGKAKERKAKDEDRINRLKQAANAEPSETPRDRFIADLTWETPNWQETLNDPKFREFLKQTNAYGVTHDESFRMAEKTNKVAPVVGIFKAYEQFLVDEDPLAEHRSPEPGASGQPNVNQPQNETKRYTPQEITQFYIDKNNGVYSIEEAAKMESEIDSQVQGWFPG